MKPVLLIFSGLPGAGKTTIAKGVAHYLNAPYFRLDTIEHGLREICGISVQGEGYRLTYRIVADNLNIGNDVVVDCCNPWELTRKEWENVAIANHCGYVNIEIVCSDKNEHQARVEGRENDINGFTLPSWEDAQNRDYQEWNEERIIIETSRRPLHECLAELLENVGRKKQNLDFHELEAKMTEQ